MKTVYPTPSAHAAVFHPAHEYPSLLRRYQAIFLDFLFLGSLLILLLLLTQNLEQGPLVVRAVFLSLLVVYEPVLTAYGATFGQWVMGIRVRQHKELEEPISMGQAYLRVILKFLLGFLSFFSIHFNPSRRALHDLYSGSVMVQVR